MPLTVCYGVAAVPFMCQTSFLIDVIFIYNDEIHHVTHGNFLVCPLLCCDHFSLTDDYYVYLL